MKYRRGGNLILAENERNENLHTNEHITEDEQRNRDIDVNRSAKMHKQHFRYGYLKRDTIFNGNTYLSNIEGFLKCKYNIEEPFLIKLLDKRKSLHCIEGALCALQDKNIFLEKGIKCSHCRDKSKSIDHMATQCDGMLCIHLQLCLNYGLTKSKKLKNHSLQECMSNKNVEIRVDTRMPTDKVKKEILIVEIEILSFDNLRSIETEKKHKYNLLAYHFESMNGITTTFHKKYRSELNINSRTQAYIQARVATEKELEEQTVYKNTVMTFLNIYNIGKKFRKRGLYLKNGYVPHGHHRYIYKNIILIDVTSENFPYIYDKVNMNKRESFRMIKRDYENNKRLFIKSYVEYHLATGRRPRDRNGQKDKDRKHEQKDKKDLKENTNHKNKYLNVVSLPHVDIRHMAQSTRHLKDNNHRGTEWTKSNLIKHDFHKNKHVKNKSILEYYFNHTTVRQQKYFKEGSLPREYVIISNENMCGQVNKSKTFNDMILFMISNKFSYAKNLIKSVPIYHRLTKVMGQKCASHIRTYVTDNSFESKLDKNTKIITFLNGMYNLSRNAFKNYLENDLCSFCIQYEYSECTDFELIESIFSDFSRILKIGNTSCQFFIGKITIKDISFFNQDPTVTNGLSPTMSDLDINSLKTNIIKRLCGNDEISSRRLFCNNFIIAMNNMPTFSNADEALWQNPRKYFECFFNLLLTYMNKKVPVPRAFLDAKSAVIQAEYEFNRFLEDHLVYEEVSFLTVFDILNAYYDGAGIPEYRSFTTSNPMNHSDYKKTISLIRSIVSLNFTDCPGIWTSNFTYSLSISSYNVWFDFFLEFKIRFDNYIVNNISVDFSEHYIKLQITLRNKNNNFWLFVLKRMLKQDISEIFGNILFKSLIMINITINRANRQRSLNLDYGYFNNNKKNWCIDIKYEKKNIRMKKIKRGIFQDDIDAKRRVYVGTLYKYFGIIENAQTKNFMKLINEHAISEIDKDIMKVLMINSIHKQLSNGERLCLIREKLIEDFKISNTDTKLYLNFSLRRKAILQVEKLSLKEYRKMSLYSNINKKTIHERLYNSSKWLDKGNISSKEEAALCDMQDRNVILKENVMCPFIMLSFDYTRRHNEVKIRNYSIQVILSYKRVVIKEDTRIPTDVKINANKPDIFIFDMQKNYYLIEVGITNADNLQTQESQCNPICQDLGRSGYTTENKSHNAELESEEITNINLYSVMSSISDSEKDWPKDGLKVLNTSETCLNPTFQIRVSTSETESYQYYESKRLKTDSINIDEYGLRDAKLYLQVKTLFLSKIENSKKTNIEDAQRTRKIPSEKLDQSINLHLKSLVMTFNLSKYTEMLNSSLNILIKKSNAEIMRQFNLVLDETSGRSEARAKLIDSKKCIAKIFMHEKRKLFKRQNQSLYAMSIQLKLKSIVSDNFPTLTEFENFLQFLPCWKAVGVDGIYNFLINRITFLYKYLYKVIKDICLIETRQRSNFKNIICMCGFISENKLADPAQHSHQQEAWIRNKS
ncbi:hypothetical protein NAPIS_ORF02409 [Vairimorpha apis BRL 01]|uniref:Uncharacterized protein n=1 Tax=Vairimorpha apis BRL 01 TaxID=1037528 RepID=T0L5T5_9MICR|nr:hypothetical protein NAPIS_ORF02409 [Vairimorpha apis BRL 01]